MVEAGFEATCYNHNYLISNTNNYLGLAKTYILRGTCRTVRFKLGDCDRQFDN